MAKQVPLNITVKRTIDASADVLYDLVSDVTRMSEWSPEVADVEWIKGATGPTVGARFKGSNAIGKVSWSTKPKVTVADPGRAFAFEVPGKSGPTWRYDFVETAEGTIVTESVHQSHPSPPIVRYFQRKAGVTDRSTHVRKDMVTTLDQLARTAEASRRSVDA